MLSDLKNFLLRGNVLDLAVAVVVGAAFNNVVKVLVDGILMPPLGFLLGGVDFKDLKIVISPAGEDGTEVALLYGQFLQSIVDFLIIGTTVFVIVKVFEKMQKKEEKKPSDPPRNEVLLEEIRDLLKK